MAKGAGLPTSGFGGMAASRIDQRRDETRRYRNCGRAILSVTMILLERHPLMRFHPVRLNKALGTSTRARTQTPPRAILAANLNCWATPHAMSKRDRYILAAFMACTLIEFWLVARITQRSRIRDWAPPDSWYVFNVALAGVVLVAMVAVLRTGRWWQRLVALVMCICPVTFIYDVCRWSATIARQ